MKGSDNNNKIRILFLSANPKGTTKLDLDKEFNAIQSVIDSADQFSLQPRFRTSVSKLQQYLINYNPQIVHFAGHGDDSVDTGIILLQDSRGKKEPASKEAIAELFRILNERKNIAEEDKIRLVVLNACFSDELAREIKKYVDCVIGMHNKIDDVASRKFAEAFYLGIVYGESVQTALDLGRNKLMLLEIPKEHLIPGKEVRNGIDANKIIFGVPNQNVDSKHMSALIGENLPVNQESSVPLDLRQEIIEVSFVFYEKVIIPEPKLSEKEFYEQFLGPVLVRLRTNAVSFGIGSFDRDAISSFLASIPVSLRSLIDGYDTNGGELRTSVRSKMLSAVDKIHVFAGNVTRSESKKTNEVIKTDSLEIILKEELMELTQDLRTFRTHVKRCVELKHNSPTLEMTGNICYEYFLNFRTRYQGWTKRIYAYVSFKWSSKWEEIESINKKLSRSIKELEECFEGICKKIDIIMGVMDEVDKSFDSLGDTILEIPLSHSGGTKH